MDSDKTLKFHFSQELHHFESFVQLEELVWTSLTLTSIFGFEENSIYLSLNNILVWRYEWRPGNPQDIRDSFSYKLRVRGGQIGFTGQIYDLALITPGSQSLGNFISSK